MIPLVFTLVLATSALALPLTTQEHVTTGIESQPQIHTEVPESQFIEKTGVQGFQGQTPVGQQIQGNTPITRVENTPTNVEQSKPAYTENPVLLPIQPLSVVPVSQVGQVFRPVIVPAEAITAGRVIIAGLEPIQQRSFQEETAPVEGQQVVQPVPYVQVQSQGVEPNQQNYYVQPVEKLTPVQQGVVPTGQGYTPVQGYIPVQTYTEQQLREHPVPVGQQPVESYNPVSAEHNQQVYSVPQKVVPEFPEKYSPGQVPSGYTPVQHQVGEKQVPFPQGYTPVQTQGVDLVNQQQQVYGGKPTGTEYVEKQQHTGFQQQVNTPHGEKHGEYQNVNTYTSGHGQLVEQGVYNVQQGVEKQGQYQQGVEKQGQYQQGVEKQGQYQQGEYQQGQYQHGVEKQGEYQQGIEKQGQYQQGFTPVQTQSVEQQTVQGVEQIPYEQGVQREEPVEPQQAYNSQQIQNRPVEQQVYSVKPSAVDQLESQVPYQQVVQQESAAAYVPEHVPKSTEVEQQQVYNVQPQQAANYPGESVYNFGEKIPKPFVQTLSGVPHTENTASVQPSVGVVAQE